MRVLMFGWEFPPYKSGGLGTACYGMGRALAKKGTEILFVLPQTPLDAPVRVGERLSLCSASGTRVERTARNLRINEEVRELWREKLHIEHVDSLLLPYDTPESYDERRRELERLQSVKRNADVFSSTQETILRLHGGYGPDLMSEVYRYACAAVAIARKARFDVIHVHDWMTYPAGILVRKLTGKPLVAHIHALEHDRSGDNMNRDVAGIERAGLEAADRVVAVSHYTKRLVMRQYGIPGDKIKVVHNAVSRSEADRVYAVPERCAHEKRVLFMGRVTFQKGPDYFVEAAKLVLGRIPDVRFVMAGSGDMLPNMVRRVAQLRIGSHFHFTGFLKDEEVDRMYAMSDLYVMPSVSEPFGIAPVRRRRSGAERDQGRFLGHPGNGEQDLRDPVVPVSRRRGSQELPRGAQDHPLGKRGRSPECRLRATCFRGKMICRLSASTFRSTSRTGCGTTPFSTSAWTPFTRTRTRTAASC